MYQFIIKDYQIIKKVALKVDGITLVKGNSGNGKSSSFRAIKAALTNRFPSNVVRHGQDFAEVKIKKDNDPRILSVKRRATGASPLLAWGSTDDPENIQRWSKLNRDMPQVLVEWLNLGYINVSNSEKYSLNFYDQFSEPLLSQFTPSKIMDILSASKAQDDLNLVRKEVDIRRTKNKGAFESIDSVLSNIKASMAEIDLKLEDYDKVDEVTPFIESYTQIENQIDELNSLKSLIEELSKLEKSVKLYKGLISDTIYKDSVNSTKQAYELMYSCINKSTYLNSYIGYSQNLIALKEQQSIIEQHYSDYKNLITHFYFYTKNKPILDEIEQLIKEVSVLESTYAKNSSDISSYNIFLNYLSSLPVTEQNVDQLKLEVEYSTIINDLKKKKDSISVQVSSLKELSSILSVQSMLTSKVEELEYVVNNNLCPLCKQPLKNHSHLV